MRVVIRLRSMTSLSDHIVSFVQWIPWADRRICSSLGQCLDARANALPIFSHLLAAEHIWLSRINRLDPQLAVWPPLTWDECLSWLEENEAGFGRLLDSLKSNKVDRVIDCCDSKGSANSTAFIDILFHVGSHGSYSSRTDRQTDWFCWWASAKNRLFRLRP